MATQDLDASNEVSSPTSPTNSGGKKRKSHTEIEVNLALPEPPSKKARRALKKGKPLPAKPASSDDEEDDADKTGDAAAKSTKEKTRSPYGVWVGNLPFTATNATLRQWLVESSGGTITAESITRVKLPMTKVSKDSTRTDGEKKAGAENKGFAYVDFATYEANVAAIALSETEFGSRKLLIKDSKSFEGRPAKVEEAADAEAKDTQADGGDRRQGAGGKAEGSGKAKSGSTSTKVFVGNLAFNIHEDELWAHFEKCGPIRWVKVATFEDTGKCKGYGWVNFETSEAADWAVKGFVKIKEAIETVEDFVEEAGLSESKDGENGGEDTKTAAPERPELARRTKVRKWWVNQLQGRTLRVELAEDDQVRYKKRFGKDAQAKKQSNGQARGPAREAAQDEGQPASESRAAKPKDEKKINYHANINEARIMGVPVAPQGKKTTFD